MIKKVVLSGQPFFLPFEPKRAQIIIWGQRILIHSRLKGCIVQSDNYVSVLLSLAYRLCKVLDFE